ncbi:hypothetical protein GGF42_008999 [Coemansia sp. RSA 2424]|nr:hypothetical protein GGF42_008999 [Coemansia sp. RSA 2424]
MHFFIVIVLFSILVALASAFRVATDYVRLMNDAHYEGAITHAYSGTECRNVHKAFNRADTKVAVLGRSVALYAGENCTEMILTTPRSKVFSNNYEFSVMSFKIND